MKSLYRHLTVFLSALTVLFFGAPFVRALDPGKAATQYVHNIWTTNDGVPQDSINAVVQTPDGYLWIATQEGIARFDGVKFQVFDSTNTDGIGSFVHTLFVARDGALWIGTGGGLMSYRDGNFSRFSTADGLPDITIKNVSQDRDGSFWLGASNRDRDVGGQGLTHFVGGRGKIYTTADGLSNNQVNETLIDRNDNLWIATGNGLNLFKNGKFTVFSEKDGLANHLVRTLFEDRSGNLWIGTNGGLNLYRDGKFTTYTIKDGLSDDKIRALFQDSGGSLWIGTDKGLNRILNGKIEKVSIPGLDDDRIFSFAEDREGSLWIGTHSNGLHRFRDGKFTTYGTPEGLRGDSVHSIFEDSTGRVWIGTADGGINVGGSGKGFAAFAPSSDIAGKRIRAIFEDRSGVIWFGTDGGLKTFADGRLSSAKLPDNTTLNNVHSIFQDRDGSIWFSTSEGLIIFKDGALTKFGKADGILGSGVNLVYRDRADRMIVAGDEGLSIYENGALRPLRAGFPAEFNVQSIAEDESGALWMTTWGQGLNRLKNGVLTAVTTKDGLFDNTAWSILDDGAGNFWMGSNRGIFRCSKQELNDFADGKTGTVASVVYGTANGMRKRETNAGSPSAIRSRDGRLWFGTTSGAVAINPRDLITNSLPPPLVIEQLIADERIFTHAEAADYEFPAGTKNLEFHYAGLSLTAPDRVRYKYRIEGFDAQWIDAENRRAAYYTNLPPGDYQFRVIAANNDGIWNETGASVRFRVLSPFWRTWWFSLFAACAAAGVITFLFKWRISRLEKSNAVQKAFSRRLLASQEQERKRIAAELHDNLGQHLIIIKNWAALGLKLSETNDQTKNRLEEISETALLAIGEVREIIYDLRPVQLETSGLTATIKFMVEQLAASSGISFTVECDHLDNLLPPEDEVIFYRSVQECVSNTVKHSHARRARLRIKHFDQKIRLELNDDGVGFAPEIRRAADQSGGFGLTGLNERIEMLGGTLHVHSAAQHGTTVKIEIPR